ncbi:recombinase family protein [Rhodococcus sp. NPDC079359]|uniref:recombinase family protein n=1 Tax=Rhodococcus sp. NPDC079359 TaxID=3154961 RepID=UPI00344C72B1
MRAIIYCRVSSDQTGKAKSVADQERECRAVCEREGWAVAEVLTDNDRGASRWSTKDRPAYRRLAEVLQPGDVLVLWEASRASRDLAAYVLLRDLCASRGVKWCVSGKLLDPNSGDDRFGSGLDALLAEREAEQIRERVLRGKRSAALEGRPNGRLPYGYRRQFNQDTGKTERWVHDPATAPVVVEIIERFLAGESLHAVARDLQARQVPPPSEGVPWRAQRIRTMISSPTYAGLRAQHGQVIGQGTWDALVSEETHHRVLGILADPARRTSAGPGVKHLLTGIATCGVCGSGMRFFGPKSLKSPTYLCAENSCVRRRAQLVDDYVELKMIALLEDHDIAPVDDVANGILVAEIERQRRRLDHFVQQLADEQITDESFHKLEKAINTKISAATAKLRRATSSPLTSRISGPNAAAHWAQLDIPDRRQAIREHLSVTILPSSVGTRQFSIDDVRVLPAERTVG